MTIHYYHNHLPHSPPSLIQDRGFRVQDSRPPWSRPCPSIPLLPIPNRPPDFAHSHVKALCVRPQIPVGLTIQLLALAGVRSYLDCEDIRDIRVAVIQHT
ncbi:hypothetical protein BDN67DRAFT_779962 [Paxillus ammoniavirescens]|nr:hypothetical protein BDN67DRAFT_779962 [Paxillus ammoniavirescens]